MPILLFALSVLFPSSAHAAPSAPIQLGQAELLVSEQITPPGRDSEGWQTVSLPDEWGLSRYADGDNGWYRFVIERPLPGALWGVYLPHLNMNAAVYFNGDLLGDGGSFDEPLGRNWSRPLYFSIPDSLWMNADNQLMIRLKSYYGYGVLGAVVVGPDGLLKKEVQNQIFWKTGLASALFFLQLTITLFMFSIWCRRRKDTMYLWFSLTTLTWSFMSLNIFIIEIPVSEKIWDSFIYSSIAWWTVFLAFFSHRFAHIRRPRWEALFILYASAATVTYLFCNIEDFPAVTSLFQVGSPVIGFIVLCELLMEWQKRGASPVAWLALGIFTIQLAGVYSFLTQAELWPFDQAFFGHLIELSSPIMLMLITWHLTGRFVSALSESEALNVELESRVADKSAELERSYRQLAALEKQQTITEERERIHRDLHDDVGAKLLSLTYRSAIEENAEIARSALQDLRDVVSRSSRLDLTLSDALADWHAECNDRLEGAEIHLDWRQADQLPNPLLVEQQIMNIGRVLREAVSNAIRHAHPKNLSITLDHNDGNIVVVIENDGRSVDTEHLGQGRGTRNMMMRAQQLGGELHWRSRTPSGCCIEWWFPLSLPEQPPSPKQGV